MSGKKDIKKYVYLGEGQTNEKIDHITVDEESSDYDELFVVDTVRELKEFMNKTHWREYRVVDSTNYDGRYYIGDSMNHIHSQILNAVADNGWFTGENRMTIHTKFYDTDFVIICPGEDNDNGVFGTDGYCVKYIFNDYTILARDYIDNTELIQKFGKLIDVIDIYDEELEESCNINEETSMKEKRTAIELAKEYLEDDIELDSYEDFADLFKSWKMNPTKELYQLYVDVYNGKSVENDYKEDVQKEFEKMSSDDIINLLGITNSSGIDMNSPMFILPNGTILSVNKVAKSIGIDLYDSKHSDIIYVILYAIAKKLGVDYDNDDPYYEEQNLNRLTYELDWVRINCGTTWLESRFYCVLPNHMTSSQYHSLEKWLEWGYDNHEEEVLVFVSSYEDHQTYQFNDNFPEDIIKKIKRYYSSGRLYEGLLHSFNKLININVTEAEQIATKYVSTTPTYQSWIDNKGRFIDASKLGSHYNLIDEVFWQLSDRGQLQDIKPWDLDPDDYNKMTDLIGDSFTTTGWIQIGLDCKWAGIFQKPTTVQYRAIEEYLDYAQHKGIGNFSINVGTGDDFTYVDYDLKEVTPEYVVSRIKRYFASGKLYENRNEMKENMNNKLTPQQAAQAVKELKLKSNPNINVYIDEFTQGVKVTFEGTLPGGKKITLWDSNILSTQEQIDTLPDMFLCSLFEFIGFFNAFISNII